MIDPRDSVFLVDAEHLALEDAIDLKVRPNLTKRVDFGDPRLRVVLQEFAVGRSQVGFIQLCDRLAGAQNGKLGILRLQGSHHTSVDLPEFIG